MHDGSDHDRNDNGRNNTDRNDNEDATRFLQTNLVSDRPGFGTNNIDPNLINPWGVSHGPGGPFWVSDNGAGVATIYTGQGTTVIPPITIAPPPGQAGPSAPTGQVFNTSGNGFDITANGMTAPSVFIFATEDGTISGWNPSVSPNSSVIAVDNSGGGTGAVYKGLTLAETHSGKERLYAANFRNGTVDVFNKNFQEIKSFTDPTLPAGYAPFNVQVLQGHLYVSFALQNSTKHDDVAGAGHGFVDEFNLQGHLMHRVASGGPLDSPWGMAIAPSNFGAFSNDLLVGNFGDGKINVYDPKTDAFLGQVLGANGFPLQIGDLWDLIPGTGAAGADQNAIYFTAGVQDEAHGLFGKLTALPGQVGDNNNQNHEHQHGQHHGDSHA